MTEANPGYTIELDVFVRLLAPNSGPVNGQPATTSFTLTVNEAVSVDVDVSTSVGRERAPSRSGHEGNVPGVFTPVEPPSRPSSRP